jgi:hypothetical protein
MRDGQPIGNELTTEHGLEGVAKGLAQGTVSRRRALGALGGILGGSLLALIPGVAWAQSNQPACVRCCKEKFAPGEKDAQGRSARGQCIAKGARTGRCPVTCDDNGNNGECPYGEEQICVPECGENQVGILLGDNRECVEDPCDNGQELTIIADTVGGGILLRCETPGQTPV